MGLGKSVTKSQGHQGQEHQTSGVKQHRAAYLSAQDRRFTLIRAAKKLMDAQPASALSPADICREAGCVRSLFYRYFSDMPDLVDQIVAYLINAAKWDYQDWTRTEADQRITPRATMESVSRLFLTLVEPVRPLYAAGNSGIVLDYIDGCQKDIAPHLLGDFVDGVSVGHRLSAEGLEETWGVFFTGLLIRLVQNPETDARDVRVLLARAFHIEALLNAW
jgi:AcrR family transcriptional regulator